MLNKKKIENLIDKILSDIIKIRHAIHQNPEIALKEYETSKLIRKMLKPCNMKISAPFLKTDVVAVMDGKGAGKNITLRADIDALPLQEKTGLAYQSKNPGFMHACGHDGHTAMLIGCALVLNELRSYFNGSVRFVFQPGEEVVAAAKDLVKKGILKNPKPDAIFAIHGASDQPLGTVASKPGVLTAGADFFKIEITGKGSHGSEPHMSIDPVLIGAKIVEALQAIASRMIAPLDPTVVSVCRFSSGTNGNIIPESAELEGTTRYLNHNNGKKIEKYMEQIIKGICTSFGASYKFTYKSPYIPIINDSGIVALGKKVSGNIFGKKSWIEVKTPSMGGEDFSYFVKDYPGAMFFLGMGKEYAPLHNPLFDFNDKALKNGILFMVSITLEALERGV